MTAAPHAATAPAISAQYMIAQTVPLIDHVQRAADRVALAMNHVSDLEDARALIKAECIRTMIGQPNPLSDTGRPHSASSAEKVVEEHPTYQAHRRQQAEAEVEKWAALGAYEAAKLRARLAVVLTTADH